MINLLYIFKDEKYGFQVTLLHLILGVLSTISPYFLVAWFFFFIGYQLGNILLRPNKFSAINIAELLIYGSAFELLARMANASPLIPYELGKYFILLLSLIGLLITKENKAVNWIGPLILLFIIPSFFIDLSGKVTFKEFRYNVFGIINVGMVVWFFSKLKISIDTYISWIRLLIFPCMAVLAFAYFKTPDYDDIEFSLGANFATTGGFGSNQVSTVLGFGAYLCIISLILNSRITGYKMGDFVLLAGFIVQGLLTFSRGGMLVAALAHVVFLFYTLKLKNEDRKKYNIPKLGKYVLPVSVLIVVLALVANMITGGMLFLRYQGQTVGTLSGSKEVDLNHFTTNRFNIMLGDLKLWAEYPVLGVGASASPYLRTIERGENPHVEFSRLLAEHGFFGLVIIVLIALVLINRIRAAPNHLVKALVFSLFIIAVLTTFHAAMRTFITPLLMGIISVTLTIKKPEAAIQKSVGV